MGRKVVEKASKSLVNKEEWPEGNSISEEEGKKAYI